MPTDFTRFELNESFVGCFALIEFAADCGAKPLYWVKLTKLISEGVFEAILDDAPAHEIGYEQGSKLQVEKSEFKRMLNDNYIEFQARGVSAALSQGDKNAA